MIFRDTWEQVLKGADGSYLLGAIHGDGHVAQRSISISMSGKIPGYDDVIWNIFLACGYQPKKYISKHGLITVCVHSADLARELRKYKIKDNWWFPSLPGFPSDYLAGLIDTDGFVAKGIQSSRINITQKSANKLHNIRPILDLLGFEHIEIITRHKNKVRGKIYPIDEIWWRKQDDVLRLALTINLRHPNKRAKLQKCVERIEYLRNKNKTYHILRVLRERRGATIPEICAELNYVRDEVLRTLNHLRRQSRVTRNDLL